MIEEEKDARVASDETLISQAQRGDMNAFEELVRRYDGKVLSMAVHFTGDPDDAKDVYQEVFLRVYRALPKFKGRSQFSTWVHRIVVNVCRTHYARTVRRRQVSIDEGVGPESDHSATLGDFLADRETAESRLLNSEKGRHLLGAMGKLSPKQKLVFTLKHYHGLKLREIASLMNCAEGTVKRHLFGATQRMRELLKIHAN